MKPVSELIKESGLTQSELAQICGVTKQHISNLANSQKNVRLFLYEKIATACGFEISVKKVKKSNTNT